MSKIIRGLNVRLQYARVALRKINMPHLGDVVEYNDTKCSLIQGVAKPRWDLLPITKENLDKPKREIWKGINEKDFKMQPLRKRFWFSFTSTYRFYMRYWYSIDVNKRGRISFT